MDAHTYVHRYIHTYIHVGGETPCHRERERDREGARIHKYIRWRYRQQEFRKKALLCCTKPQLYVSQHDNNNNRRTRPPAASRQPAANQPHCFGRFSSSPLRPPVAAWPALAVKVKVKISSARALYRQFPHRNQVYYYTRSARVLGLPALLASFLLLRPWSFSIL